MPGLSSPTHLELAGKQKAARRECQVTLLLAMASHLSARDTGNLHRDVWECCRCWAVTLRAQDNKEILKKSRSISSHREALSKSNKPQAEQGEGGLGTDHWDNGPRTKGLH